MYLIKRNNLFTITFNNSLEITTLFKIGLSTSVLDDSVSARKDLDDQDMITVLERCCNVIQGRRTSLTSNSSAMTTVSLSNHCSLLSKHLKTNVFENIRFRMTKLDHNLYDLIWPSVKKLPTDLNFRVALEQDFPLGIVVPDFYAYKVFGELLEPIIKDYNNKDLHYELPSHPQSDFIEKNSNENVCDFNSDLDLDPHSKWIITGIIFELNDVMDT